MVKDGHPTRRDYYTALAKMLPDNALMVTALGNASYLWATIREAPENFYLEDAMGLALPLAVGLAVSQPERHVVVVEGDGGLMMHLGCLVTAGAVAPGNLTILLIQNGIHAASGGQALTNPNLDFASLALAADLRHAENIATVSTFKKAFGPALARKGPSLLALATQPDIEVSVPPQAFDPVVVKRRFAEAVGAPRYVPTMFGGGLRTTP